MRLVPIMGGAGVHYSQPIADRYDLELTVVNSVVDPTFGFMTLDWDGNIRMDPSSPYAMQSLIGLKDRFDDPAGSIEKEVAGLLAELRAKGLVEDSPRG